ncbi:hypothetical protein [Jeotgalibacillus sp. R-1-5s-1]|nr:hypothetical protein [Jeotgalibacillus sp. R-1-5s-1]
MLFTITICAVVIAISCLSMDGKLKKIKEQNSEMISRLKDKER